MEDSDLFNELIQIDLVTDSIKRCTIEDSKELIRLHKNDISNLKTQWLLVFTKFS